MSVAQLPGPALAGRDADFRLVRAVAIALLGAIAILALYFGRDVLIPTALAMFFAFILGPALTWVRRFLPLPLAVGVVVTGGLVVGGIVAVLVFSQLADVAGSLTRYQANLHQKIQDVRALSEGGGAVSRFMSMAASLAHDLNLDAGPAAVPAVRVQSGMSSFASVVGFVAPCSTRCSASESSSSWWSSSWPTATISATSSCACSAPATCTRRPRRWAMPPRASHGSWRCSFSPISASPCWSG